MRGHPRAEAVQWESTDVSKQNLLPSLSTSELLIPYDTTTLETFLVAGGQATTGKAMSSLERAEVAWLVLEGN